MFSLESVCALCKISDVNTTCTSSTFFIQFQPNCTESMVIRGKYRLWLFSKIYQILKLYSTVKINHVSYIASIHKAMFVSSSKRSSRSSRQLGCFCFFHDHAAESSDWGFISVGYWCCTYRYLHGYVKTICLLLVFMWRFGPSRIGQLSLIETLPLALEQFDYGDGAIQCSK